MTATTRLWWLMAALVASGCGQVEQIDNDAAVVDDLIDAASPPPDGGAGTGALTLLSGRIATTGPGGGASAGYRLGDDGLEFVERTCEQRLCLRGGLVP